MSQENVIQRNEELEVIKHFPNGRDVYDYFASRFCLESGMVSNDNNFGQKLFKDVCGIEDTRRIELVDFFTGSYVGLKIETGENIPSDNGPRQQNKGEYYVVVWFHKPDSGMRAFRKADESISRERRFQVVIELLENYIVFNKPAANCSYGNEIGIGARQLSSIIDAEPSNDPKLKFFEGSLRWTAKELKGTKEAFLTEKLEGYDKPIFNSAVSVVSFALTYLSFALSNMVSRFIYCHGEVIDSDNSRISISFPCAFSLPSILDGEPLDLDPTIEFTVSVGNGVVKPYFYLAYSRADFPDGWRYSIEEDNVRKFAKERLAGINGIQLVEPAEIDVFTPVACFDEVRFDLENERKGKTDFVDGIVDLVGRAFFAFQ